MARLATPFRPTMSTALQIYSFELYSCVPWWTAWFLTDSVMQMLARPTYAAASRFKSEKSFFPCLRSNHRGVSMRNGACFFREGPKRKRKLCSPEGAREPWGRGSEILQSELRATFPILLDHWRGLLKGFLSKFKDWQFFLFFFSAWLIFICQIRNYFSNNSESVKLHPILSCVTKNSNCFETLHQLFSSLKPDITTIFLPIWTSGNRFPLLSSWLELGDNRECRILIYKRSWKVVADWNGLYETWMTGGCHDFIIPMFIYYIIFGTNLLNRKLTICNRELTIIIPLLISYHHYNN